MSLDCKPTKTGLADFFSRRHYRRKDGGLFYRRDNNRRKDGRLFYRRGYKSLFENLENDLASETTARGGLERHHGGVEVFLLNSQNGSFFQNMKHV